MKRHEFLRHLRRHGCVFVREGSGHSLYENPANGKVETVPRHTEIRNMLIRGICSRLNIPSPWDKS